MKKVNLWMLLVIIISTISFTGCSKNSKSGDTLFVNVERNDSTVNWKGDWLRKYGEKDTSLIINRYEYSTLIDHLPSNNDMTSPSGKVFGGWYFDSDCSEGNNINLYNWEQKAIVSSKPTKLDAYAKWIDDDYINIILNLDNNEANFINSNEKSKELLISRSEISNILSMLPSDDDVSLNNSTLVGWSLTESYSKYDKSNVTQEQIEQLLESQSYINLYANWQHNQTLIRLDYKVYSEDNVTGTINLDHFIKYETLFDYNHPYSPRVVKLSKKSDSNLSCYFFVSDSIELMKSYAPSMDDIIVTNSRGKDVTSKYKVVGYKIGNGNDIIDWDDDYIKSQFDNNGLVGFTIYIIISK
jgi:hypothetical protein